MKTEKITKFIGLLIFLMVTLVLLFSRVDKMSFGILVFMIIATILLMFNEQTLK